MACEDVLRFDVAVNCEQCCACGCAPGQTAFMAEPSVRTSHRGPCPAIKAFETNYHNNLQWPSDSLKMIVSYFKRVFQRQGCNRFLYCANCASGCGCAVENLALKGRPKKCE